MRTPPLFLADEEKILHILENLGSNAIKYTDRQGNVSIKVSYEAGKEEIHFEVADNGIGIPESDRKLIFDKFIQGESALARPVSGSGLGLALAKEYAELHGGTISVESEVGKGSAFIVAIPFDEPLFDLD